MSIFDVVGSLMWIFSTALQPKYMVIDTIPSIANNKQDNALVEFEDDTIETHKARATGVYGAVGNEQTCRLQGVLFQLSYAAIFYNVVLSVYFVLVIKFGWSQEKLLRLRWQFLLPPLLMGVVLAAGAWSHIGPTSFLCHVRPSPWDERWAVWVFSINPVFAVLGESFLDVK